MVQLVDAFRQLDRQAAVDSVIFVVKGVVVFLRHENGKQVLIRPFSGVADRDLPRGVVADLAAHVTHRIDRGAAEHLA